MDDRIIQEILPLKNSLTKPGAAFRSGLVDSRFLAARRASEVFIGRCPVPVVYTVSAPVAPILASSMNEIVSLLIGATIGDVERELVLHTLARCDGNRTHAARVLGVSVRTLRNRIREYSASGIDVPPHSDKPHRSTTSNQE